MNQAICVDVACMHSDSEIVPLEQPESILFILKQVDAFGYFADFQFFQTRLIFKTLLYRKVDLISHFDGAHGSLRAWPVARIVQDKSIFVLRIVTINALEFRLTFFVLIAWATRDRARWPPLLSLAKALQLRWFFAVRAHSTQFIAIDSSWLEFHYIFHLLCHSLQFTG